MTQMLINHHQFTLNSAERDRHWEEHRRYFKDYCVNRYQWFQYPKWRYVAPFPLHVDFEASFRCNLKCPMCFRHHLDKKEYGDMDFDLYKKGIDECAAHGLYSIRLSWRGESTLHPKLIDMIVYAKEKGVKEVSFLSNGHKIDKHMSKELIKAELDYITISVDGMESQYNALRFPLKFNETAERIRTLFEMKNAIGDGYPLVKVQGIWTHIKDDPETYYNFFSQITDKVNFNPEHDYSKEDVPQDPNFVCQYPWQRLSICWNGEIPMCISDWNAKDLLGDLKEQSLRDVWFGEPMRSFRELHVCGKRLTHAACRYCHRPSAPQIGDRPEGKDL